MKEILKVEEVEEDRDRSLLESLGYEARYGFHLVDHHDLAESFHNDDLSFNRNFSSADSIPSLVSTVEEESSVVAVYTNISHIEEFADSFIDMVDSWDYENPDYEKVRKVAEKAIPKQNPDSDEMPDQIKTPLKTSVDASALEEYRDAAEAVETATESTIDRYSLGIAPGISSDSISGIDHKVNDGVFTGFELESGSEVRFYNSDADSYWTPITGDRETNDRVLNMLEDEGYETNRL